MSAWDNVQGVQAIALFAGTNESGHATLFVNQYHQIPVTLYVTFKLFDETGPIPTEADIREAVTWLDFNSGSPPSLLVEAEDNGYRAFYDGQNSLAQARIDSLLSSADRDAYTSSVPFQIQAMNYAQATQSQLLSLMIRGARSDNTYFVYDCTDPENIPAYLTFSFNEPQSDSMSNTNATSIIKQEEPVLWDILYYANPNRNSECFLSAIRIDSELFYIHDFTTNAKFLDIEKMTYTYKEHKNAQWNFISNMWMIAQDLGIPDTEHEVPHFYLTVTVFPSNGEQAGMLDVCFSMKPHSLYFLSYATEIDHYGDDSQHNAQSFWIDIHDQYGNSARIGIEQSTHRPYITSVV